MIIDCHAHVFQPWIDACGHETATVHLRYLQRMLSGTVAETYRLRDGERVEPLLLRDPADPSWDGLYDVALRVGRFGQIAFTVDGEDYGIQYMPVGMQQIEAPPELMRTQMAYAGVDHCVLQAGGPYGAMTDYNAFARNQYPGDFTALAHLAEGKWATAEGPGELDRAHTLGARGVYFNMEGLARHGFREMFDSPAFDPFWSRIQELGLVLCMELSAAPTYDRAGYIANATRLAGVLDRFPDLRCHLAMGPPVSHFAQNGVWEFPEELASLYRRDGVWVEVMFPITWGGLWDYPYPEAQALIRSMRDWLGAGAMIWGSDMPNVERFCTYRQSLDYVRRYCGFLTESEKDAVLGENTAAIYGIELS